MPSVAAVAAKGPVEELLVGYREYLALERGLAGSTIVKYSRTGSCVPRAAAGGA